VRSEKSVEAGRILIVGGEGGWATRIQRELGTSSFAVESIGSLAEANGTIHRERIALLVFGPRLGAPSTRKLVQTIRALPWRPPVVLAGGDLDVVTRANLQRLGVVMLDPAVRGEQIAGLAKGLVPHGRTTDWVNAFCRDHGASDRERQVLQLAVHGLQNKEIAHRLACAPSTVISYWRRLFQKTGCKTRGELLALLIRYQAEHPAICANCPHLEDFLAGKASPSL